MTAGTATGDPHPGNLLRTPDGRLCILDWGLVQEMPADLRLTMIEHIAHLVSRDYAKVPNDQNTKRQVQKAFGDFDVDGSGTVSMSEFIKALERFGMHVAGQRPGIGGLPMDVVALRTLATPLTAHSSPRPSQRTARTARRRLEQLTHSAHIAHTAYTAHSS